MTHVIDGPFLEVADLTRDFGNGAGIHGVGIRLDQGKSLCLLGPSGCGKTTVLRCIAGLLEPMRGSIRIAGEDLLDVPAHQRNVGMVFQTWALFPHLSVVKNVEFGLRRSGASRKEATARAMEALELVGLTDLATRRPQQLSGGQQQRVAVARAVAPRPRLLLLDEPLSSLDYNTRMSLRSDLRTLQLHLGMSWLYVTHDYSEALAVSDQIAIMSDGRIIETGDSIQLYSTPRHRVSAAFLGHVNQIAAEVVGIDAPTSMVEVSILGSHCRLPGPSEPVKVGDDVIVGLRHGDVRVQVCDARGHSTPSTKAISAKVRRMDIEAAFVRYGLDLTDGQRVQAISMDAVDVTSGDVVDVSFDWSKAWILSP